MTQDGERGAGRKEGKDAEHREETVGKTRPDRHKQQGSKRREVVGTESKREKKSKLNQQTSIKKKKRKTREITDVQQTQRPSPVRTQCGVFVFPTADGEEFLGKVSRTCQSKQRLVKEGERKMECLNPEKTNVKSFYYYYYYVIHAVLEVTVGGSTLTLCATRTQSLLTHTHKVQGISPVA